MANIGAVSRPRFTIARARSALLLAVALTLLAACASPAPSATTGAGSAAPQQSSTPKRLKAAASGDIFSLSYKVSSATAGVAPGTDAVEELVNAGLQNHD